MIITYAAGGWGGKDEVEHGGRKVFMCGRNSESVMSMPSHSDRFRVPKCDGVDEPVAGIREPISPQSGINSVLRTPAFASRFSAKEDSMAIEGSKRSIPTRVAPFSHGQPTATCHI